MPALHVILGDLTANKLDEILQVTEETKTGLVARLIREEWDRQREKMPPVIVTGPADDLSTGPEDAVRRRFMAGRAFVSAGTDRERIFVASPDGQSDRVL